VEDNLSILTEAAGQTLLENTKSVKSMHSKHDKEYIQGFKTYITKSIDNTKHMIQTIKKFLGKEDTDISKVTAKNTAYILSYKPNIEIQSAIVHNYKNGYLPSLVKLSKVSSYNALDPAIYLKDKTYTTKIGIDPEIVYSNIMNYPKVVYSVQSRFDSLLKLLQNQQSSLKKDLTKLGTIADYKEFVLIEKKLKLIQRNIDDHISDVNKLMLLINLIYIDSSNVVKYLLGKKEEDEKSMGLTESYNLDGKVTKSSAEPTEYKELADQYDSLEERLAEQKSMIQKLFHKVPVESILKHEETDLAFNVFKINLEDILYSYDLDSLKEEDLHEANPIYQDRPALVGNLSRCRSLIENSVLHDVISIENNLHDNQLYLHTLRKAYVDNDEYNLTTDQRISQYEVLKGTYDQMEDDYLINQEKLKILAKDLLH